MKKLIALYFLVFLALSGCTNEDIILEETIQGITEHTNGRFTVSASDYESEDSQTRSTISKDLKFSWKSGDAIGVYPETGVQLRFPLESGEDSQTATFDGKGWNLKPSMKYAAYFPVSAEALNEGIKGSEIPISYSGQKQMANGNTSHLSKYDFMVATSMSPNGNSINFDFKHVGSILYFELPIETTSTFTKLSLVATEPIFTKSATLNVFTGELTPDILENSVSIELNNITVTDGGILKAWMMIAPADLSGKKLKLVVEEETRRYNKVNVIIEKNYRKISDIQGMNFESEKAYCLADETSSFSELTHAQMNNGRSVNLAIKSLAKDSEVNSSYEHDEIIEKIVFDCNSSVDTGRTVGNGIYANYDGNGTITISTAADIIDLNNDSGTLFTYLTKLKRIENISSLYTGNVTTMNAMFSYCTSLSNLDLSNFDTSNVRIFNLMFDNCNSLSSIDISNFNTSSGMNMCAMFSDCKSLKNIDLSNFTTRGVSNMGMMFSGCSSLTSLDVSNFDTSNVTNMNAMFSHCTSLSNLDLSNFDTRRVKDMSAMFSYCKSLKNIVHNNLNTSNVTNMDCMFSDCTSLSNLDLSNFDTSNVTNMRFMFYNCSSLTNLDISGFNTGNVTNMEYMFGFCRSLTKLDVSGFNTGNVIYMNLMFYGCSSLTSLNVSNFNTGNVTSMRSLFTGCSSITNLDVSNFDTHNVTEMGGMFSECSSLTNLDVSNFNTGNVKSISGMFSGCSSLTNIDVSNFSTSKVTGMTTMFYGCSSLTSLDVSNFNTGNVTNMSSMFYGCNSLSNLDLSNFDTGNVIYMNSMFYGCSSLSNIDLSNFDTSKVNSMSSLFYGCSSLSNIDLSNFDTSEVLFMSSMFYECKSLTSLKLGINFTISDGTRITNMLTNVGINSHCTIYNGIAETADSLKDTETGYDENYISFGTI